MTISSHYQKFPCMQPWIGSQYHATEKRLLFIGESHYLPEYSIIHQTPETWYNSTQEALSKKEIEWIHTSEIISDAKATNFKNRAYGIFKNIATELNNFRPENSYLGDALDHICYYNYYQRPAKTGLSLNVEQQDREVSTSVLSSLLEKLRPDGIIFTSSLAGGAASKFLDDKKLPYIVAPHPTCHWWNRSAKKYGNVTGRELVVNFLHDLRWQAKL